MEYIYFCPSCKSTFGLNGYTDYYCTKCDCQLMFSGYIDSVWYNMPENEREEKKRSIIALNEAQDLQFNATDSVKEFISYDANTRFVHIDGFFVPVDKIYGFDLLEDGMQITSGGLGAAVAGGVIGSLAPNLIGRSTGAIIGAAVGKRKTTSYCSSMDIIFLLADWEVESLEINLLDNEVSRGSSEYIEAKINGEKIIIFLNRITDANNVEQGPFTSDQPAFSAANMQKEISNSKKTKMQHQLILNSPFL